MTDHFRSHQPSLQSPAAHLTEVVPDDAQDLPFASRAIVVGQPGAVRLTTIAGETGTIHIAAGVPFPIRATRIWADGTTAADIVALA